MYNILKSPPPSIIAGFMTRIYDRRLTTPSGGNISMLDEHGNLWVTPSMMDKGNLHAEDMVCIDANGTVTGKNKPTMEYLFHQGIYEARPEVKSVIHAHPAGLVTLSVLKEVPEFMRVKSLMGSTGTVGFSGYALPGSTRLRDVVKAAFDGPDQAILMENHGVITVGIDMLEAFHRLENLERMANIYINACRLGKVIPIPETENQQEEDESSVVTVFLKKHVPSEQETSIRKSLLEFFKRCYMRDLSTSTAGCLSVRLSDGSFLITPCSEDVYYMGPQDMVYIEKGKVEPGKKPSPYWTLHQAIYDAQPGIHSIGYMQPAAATAFAIGDAPFETRTIPESYMVLRTMPKIGMAMAAQDPKGTAALITSENPNCLIENDGLLVTGASLFQVFDRLEVAEFTAQSLMQSKITGKLRRMSDRNIKEIEKNFF